MPGLGWEGTDVKPLVEPSEAAHTIVQYVVTLPAPEVKVSKKKIIAAIGIHLGKDAKAQAFEDAALQLAIKRALNPAHNWIVEARSLVRRN